MDNIVEAMQEHFESGLRVTDYVEEFYFLEFCKELAKELNK